MVKRDVNINVTNDVTNWEKALADAEQSLEKAKREVTQWKGVIGVIHNRIKHGTPWPGSVEKL